MNFLDPLQQAQAHLDTIARLAPQIRWTKALSPKPGAMTAFEGRVGDYLILVVEANSQEEGHIIYEGMATAFAPSGLMAIHMSREQAETLWGQAKLTLL